MYRILTYTIWAAAMALPALPQAVAPREFRAPEQEKLLRVMRQALPSRNRVLPRLAAYILTPLDNEQLRSVVRNDGPQRIGVHRRLRPEAMQSVRRDGQIWRLAVQSPNAAAVRLHFTRFDVGNGQVWIHDGSGDEDQVFGPYVGRGPNNDGDFWSATVFSDTATVEYQPADGKPADAALPFAIEEISHQFFIQAATKPVEQATAGSCELDVNCYPDWAATAKGVALLSYEKPDGSYNCTGTLLNTRNNSHIPYLLTANHCIAADSVAHTLEATWFFQKDSCNGVLPNRSFPRSVGASLIATGDLTKGDFTLLRLTSIPDGVTLQGWDPTEQPVGKSFAVIHHPSADYKRISFGKVSTSTAVTQQFYWVQYTAGITEHGSSGSGMYSSPGILVGTLTTGLPADTAEGFCRINPYQGSFGKFSSYYPLLRDALEGQAATSQGTTPAGTNPLTSGVAQSFTLAAVPSGALLNGGNGFSITVPQGATRLDIGLRATTPNADLALFVRYGQDVTLDSGRPVADYGAHGANGNSQLTITTSSSPTLRAGTYYIAIGELSTNLAVTGSILATVTTASAPPPAGGSTALSSGAARNFTVPAVTDPTLFAGTSGFTIDVPQGATRLEVKLASSTKASDLDLYVRYGQDVGVNTDGIVADYGSEGDDSNESIVVTTASAPPLKAGTYYIAFVSWNPGVAVNATVTATVSTGSVTPPPSGGNVLTSGRTQSFTLNPVDGPTFFNGASGFTVTVPQGATSLDIVLHTITPNADVDLFARYNQDIGLENGELAADYGSDGPTGEERITINASSNPPLQPGTYYISLVLYTEGIPVNGTITATVGSGNTTPPPAGGATVLTSGTRQTLFFNPVSDPTFFNGNKSYVIDVPANATKLDVQLTSSSPGVDMDLFVRYGQDNGINSEGFIADYASEGPDGNERITITPASNPALRPGRYYISIALYTTGANVLGSITATVTNGSGGVQEFTSGNAAMLTAGQAAKFSLPAVTSPTLFSGDHSFQVMVPPGARQMRIQVVSDNPGADIDMYVRYQADIGVDDKGSPIADYTAEGPTGNETITVTSTSASPLRPGLYHISLARFSHGMPSTGTITVTFSNDIPSRPNTAGSGLTSGIPVSYSMPAVTSPTMFAGSSAYRISVDRRHSSLRLSLKDNAPGANVVLYVRRGRQPEVVNGTVLADLHSTPGSSADVVLEGADLRPGVYYIALGQYANDVAAAGTLTATLTSSDSALQEFHLASPAGLTIRPKPAGEQRYSLPDVNTPPSSAGLLVKHSSRLKKRQAVKVAVGL